VGQGAAVPAAAQATALAMASSRPWRTHSAATHVLGLASATSAACYYSRKVGWETAADLQPLPRQQQRCDETIVASSNDSDVHGLTATGQGPLLYTQLRYTQLRYTNARQLPQPPEHPHAADRLRLSYYGLWYIRCSIRCGTASKQGTTRCMATTTDAPHPLPRAAAHAERSCCIKVLI
jgi:hypothetical protein